MVSAFEVVGLWILSVGVSCAIVFPITWIPDWLDSRRELRTGRIEAELRKAEDELSGALARLTTDLGFSAHEARKARILAAFAASQNHDHVPDSENG